MFDTLIRNFIFPNFNKNNSINQRFKRIRHVTTITGRNLQINALRFNIWLTFHSCSTNSAFYITDKKENDHNPKFNLKINKLINSNKLANKECIIRLWYSDLDKSIGESLCLLMEMLVNFDSLMRLNDHNLKYCLNNFNNILIFEIFGYNFCEPLDFLDNEEYMFTKNLLKTKEISMKNSYSYNLMVRLHDFQRVMHETLFKIKQLKNTSMIRFDASSRLRALQVKREELLQKIYLYKQQQNTSNEKMDELANFNEYLRLITNQMKERLSDDKQKHQIEIEKLKESEKNHNTLIKMNTLMEFKLKQRQKKLVSELAKIFYIENKIEIINQSNNTNLNSKHRMRILSNLSF
jgi:hypothetical protein